MTDLVPDGGKSLETGSSLQEGMSLQEGSVGRLTGSLPGGRVKIAAMLIDTEETLINS